MNQPISSLNLSANIIETFHNSGFFHCNDISSELLVQKNIQNWKEAISAPKTQTAQEIYEEEQQSIITPIEELDSLLQNHLVSPGSITELCGGSGTGKTQICFLLAASVQATQSIEVESEVETVFVSTNKNFAPHRFKEIVSNVVKKLKLDHASVESVCKNVHCFEILDPIELKASLHVLENWLPHRQNKVKLLIVDSMAFCLKQSNFAERGSMIYTIFQRLRFFARTYKLAVVITNDLTTRINTNETIYTPCFGEGFAHCVDTRVVLSTQGSLFMAEIVKSSTVPVKRLQFHV